MVSNVGAVKYAAATCDIGQIEPPEYWGDDGGLPEMLCSCCMKRFDSDELVEVGIEICCPGCAEICPICGDSNCNHTENEKRDA